MIVLGRKRSTRTILDLACENVSFSQASQYPQSVTQSNRDSSTKYRPGRSRMRDQQEPNWLSSGSFVATTWLCAQRTKSRCGGHRPVPKLATICPYRGTPTNWLDMSEPAANLTCVITRPEVGDAREVDSSDRPQVCRVRHHGRPGGHVLIPRFASLPALVSRSACPVPEGPAGRWVLSHP